MSFINKLWIRLFSDNIGKDIYGNMYYQSNKTDYLNNKRRYVIYKGLEEPSKVPPEWHAWIHHLSDELPINNNYSWQKPYLPNLTGTKFRYHPEISKGIKKLKYDIWKPNEK